MTSDILPGAEPLPAETAARVEQTRAARGPDYQPRSRHLNPDGTAKYTNRLFLESSPYLLQHAHNPVNWYPWGDEAFEDARRLGRPVLMSIGYSTCHWCHVMEEESFEDEAIAGYMNQNYVAVKVDREERADVDAIYMAAVQALTGGGGWPLNVWLTPERKPFYGGTYFPPHDGHRGGHAGFMTVLRQLKQLYDSQPERVAQASAQLAEMIREHLAPALGRDETLPDAQVLAGAAHMYRQRYDPVYGGLDHAPKFPSSLPIRFLLRQYRRAGDDQARDMAALTLEQMAAGGIHDQAGGGFHRYSTDHFWLVPHFEKMLYDNALLTMAYLDGFQLTGRQAFARVVRDLLRYIERDMTSAEGAFYSATDADSLTPKGHREEGWFFTWTPAELDAVLGTERSRLIKAYYAVTSYGNFEGRNILHTPEPAAAAAAKLGASEDQLLAAVTEAREILYHERLKRPPPLRDEKFLSAWNGLMIGAHAQAALLLGEDDYARRAERAADFILTNLRPGDRLLRSYKDGQARHNAYLDDYAFLTAGLLDLYEATGRHRWLAEALDLDRVLARHYEDTEHGGFYMTSDDHEQLLAREKPAYDGAEPSGNSVAAMNLLRLHAFTGRAGYRQRAEQVFRAFGPVLRKAPAALAEMLLAVDFYLANPREIIIVTPSERREAEPFLAVLRARFLPHRVLVVATAGAELEELAELVPPVRGKVALAGQATAYVCRQGACELPTTDPEVFMRQLDAEAG